MSASPIGRLRSSAFRLSTTAASASLAAQRQKFAFVFVTGFGPESRATKSSATFGAFKLVGRLRLPENLCGFRILVVLRGFYGNARNKACESNEADRYQMVAAPPLMHRKGHAGPRDQQRHQNVHAICEL